MAQEYQLPDLPYAYNALEPVISEEIMMLHHQKHHQTYVNNLNALLKQYEEAEKAKDLEKMISLQPGIKFNGGGHINHSIFWTNLAPISETGGKVVKGDLLNALNEKYGSLEKFIEVFNAKAAPIQGSGWCWLGFCPKSHRLVIKTCSNQDPLSSLCGYIPLLGIDVWEHAYYLQYKNARPEYLKNIWKVVNWENVSKRYCAAVKQCGAK